MAKPGDFYVGVLSFFAVILPGMIGVAIFEPVLGPYLRESILPLRNDDIAARWTLFVVVSYFVGHIIFMAGAYIDPLYNWIRKRRDPYDERSPYRYASLIKQSLLDPDESGALNTFQWGRALLTALHAGAAADVHLLEAESKFFRSLLVVFAIGAATFAARQRWVEMAACVLLIIPCAMRYYERRLKSTTQTYIYVVALHRAGKLQGSSTNGAKKAE